MKTSIFILLLSSIIPLNLFAQDFALQQLEKSPRHHEWIEIPNGSKTVHSFLVFPEISTKATSVVIIHENRGLTDWVRSFSDQLAEKGFLVITPDLLSEFSEEYSKTEKFPSSDDARKAIYQLEPSQVLSDLDATIKFIKSHSASNGKVIIAGFCWGGSQSFRYATHSDAIEAAMVFYGSPPDTEEAISRISVPVYGFYGENDARINSTIESTEKQMKKHQLVYDYEIYPGAGHAFMRRGDDPNGDEMNKKARDAAFERMLEILRGF